MKHIEDFQVIIKNAAKCLICNDLIESKHGHDFVRCTCGNLFVDGGKNYLRRGWANQGMYKEMSEFQNMTLEELTSKIDRCEKSALDYSSSYFQDKADTGKELLKEWYGITYSR